MIGETDCKQKKAALLAILTEELPPIASRLGRLAALLAAHPVDLKQLASLIRGDRQLTVKLLRWSEVLGAGQRRVKRVEEAAILLGTERLRNLIFADCLMALADDRIGHGDLEKFWAHSLAAAVLGESIARAVGYDDSERAYLGGVVHDWGKIPLLMAADRESETLLGSGRDNESALESERLRFGFDHCQVGRRLGIAWNFDPGLIEVLEWHHQPGKARFDPDLVGIVAAADRFLDSANNPASLWAIDDVYRACFRRLGEKELADLVSWLAREYTRMGATAGIASARIRIVPRGWHGKDKRMKKWLDAEPIVFRHAAPENPWPMRMEKAAAAVFGELAGGQIAPACAFNGRYGDVTAAINFTGAISGLLKVCCSSAAAKSIARRMLGVPAPSEEQTQFILGEAAYRIARKIRCETCGPAAQCLLSSPMAGSPENAECEDPLAESYLVVFDFQGFPIWIRLSLCS